MSNRETNPSPAGDPSLLRRVDQICDAFETAWQRGQEPLIEGFLGDTAGAERIKLFKELLRLELEYRLKRGRLPALADYERRFPNQVDVIRAAFAQASLAEAMRRRAGGAENSPSAAVAGRDRSRPPAPSASQRSTSPPTESGATVPPEARPGSSEHHGPPPSLDKLPAPFGRYRLDRLLGQGGMGSVYLAYDAQLDRSVALKIPQLDATPGSVLLARFSTGARAAAALRHPHICPIYEVGEVDGIPYLTMAYIDGKPLGDFVQDRRLLQRQSALLVRKLALALQEAHKRGIIHRDLKPGNVMIDRRGEPMLMDFGLARRTRPGDARLTQEGAVMGTPAYMAPEQARGDLDTIGPASDVYSLGVMLYELLADRLPFTGDPIVMLAHVLLDEPPPPSDFRSDLDPPLEAICLKAMAKKVEDRYASMAELAEELSDYLRNKTPGSAIAEETRAERRASPQETHNQSKGMRVTQMGGLRSIAQLPVPLAPIEKPDRPRPRPRRKQARKRRIPWLVRGLVWAGILLIAGGVLIYWRTNYGTIRIKLDPHPPIVDGFDVDGEAVESMDGELRLRAGTHQLTVTAPNFEEEHQTFTVHRGHNPDLVIKLRRPWDTSPQPSSLSVLTIPEVVDLKAGETKKFTVTVERRNCSGPIRLEIRNLPSDVDMPQAVIVEGAKTGEVQLAARLDARAARQEVALVAIGASAQSEPAPFRLRVASVEPERTPDSKSYDTPFGPWALVSHPTKLDGVHAWTLVPRVPWDGIFRMAYHPKDGRLAIGCADHLVRIYDRLGSLTGVLVGHTARVDEVAWSRDGQMLASGSDDKTIRLWDAASLLPVGAPLLGHKGSVHNLAWSPDSKSLASATEPGGELFIWEVATGRPRTLLTEHPGEIRGLSWSPDGDTLVSAEMGESRVRFWDVRTGQERPLPKQPNMTAPHYPAWSPGGQLMAVRGAKEIRILKPDGTLARESLHQEVAKHSFSGNVVWLDDRYLFVGSLEGSVLKIDRTHYDRAKPRQVKELAKPPQINGGVSYLALSADGRRLAAENANHSVQIYDAVTGKALPPPLVTDSWGSWSILALSADGKHVAATLTSTRVGVWDEQGTFVDWQAEKPVRCLAWSPDGRLVAVVDDGGTVQLREPSTGKSLAEWNLKTERVEGHMNLAWLADSKHLLIQSKEVVLWDTTKLKDPQRVGSFAGSSAYTLSLAVSHDGKRVAAGGNGAVQVWDGSSREPTSKQIAVPGKQVQCLAWSPDGQRLALGLDGDNEAIRIWDFKDSWWSSIPPIRTGNLRALDWSADGTRLASCNDQGKVYLWDASSGKQVGELQGHRLTTHCLGWARKGNVLATRDDLCVRFWDGKLQRHLGSILMLKDEQWLALDAQGHHRASESLQQNFSQRFVYLVETKHTQEALTSEAFTQSYRWKNDPMRLFGP
jgi:WD40 repeat protein/serine/threonine protein kinase